MLVTETVPCIQTSAKSMKGGEINKRRKTVSFQEEIATVVAVQDDTISKDNWYSGLDLDLEKQGAKALAEHLRHTQPVFVQEIEEAYNFTRAQKVDRANHLFATWHKLGSGRRGLERFVIHKEARIEKLNNTKATRSVVFNLQTLFKRASAGAPLTAQQTEIIAKQYFEVTRASQNLARIYAKRDEAIVQPYYAGEDNEDEDELEMEDLLLDESLISVGSGSVSSRHSKSAKKMKKRSERRSSSDKKSRKSSSKKSSSSKGNPPVPRVRRPAPKAEDTSLRAV